MLLVTFIGLLAWISGLFGTPLNHLKAFKRDFCDGRNDGNYSIPDVFKYIHCKGGVSNTMSCQDNFIFSPGVSCCVNISTQSPKTFCEDRQNGDYTDPWNCHKFFKCNEGYSYLFDCQLSNLVFNPYTDQCMYENEYPCHQVSGLLGTPVNNPKVRADDPCNGKVDGNYPLPDIFNYLSCTGGKGLINSCPDRAIFEPSLQNCRDISTVTTSNFCLLRPDGDYMNPWNCQRYLQCIDGATRDYPCLINEFVFNPELDVCVLPAKYPCKQISSTVLSNLNRVNTFSGKSDEILMENPCAGKADGNYLIPDVFAYLQCSSQQGRTLPCPANQIFDPIYSSCRDAGEYNLTNFCKGKPDNQYRNPWNCHSFISCSNGISHNMPCPVSNLVYDPYNNICEYPYQFPCKILNSLCAGKADGKYLIPDVFAYLQCSSQQGGYVNCPDNQIFDPKYSDCKDAKYYNLNNFCTNKPDGQYRNPWNCHTFISCSNGLSHNMSCATPVLVYDPYDNLCEYPSLFPCRTVNMKILMDNPCAGKADGNYLIPDVFAYLQCSSQQGKTLPCPANQIFDPIYSSCRDAGETNFNNFCIGKPDGQYRNPWNCHSFISCSNGVSHNMSCPVSNLVYDPYNNICEYPYQFPCKILNSLCAGKADGKYLIPDVFAYLQCSSQQGGYVNCPDNQIFDPKYSDCKDAKDYNLNNFCTNKPDGQYRNPWNCHTFISCSNGISHNMSCATPVLVYDPYDNLCEYPSLFPCRTVNMKILMDNPCAGKADGNYLIPDVFAYLQCSSQQGKTLPCPANQIFDPIYSSCRDAGETNFNNFCIGKPDGQYRNPWNCHSFISCSNGVSHNMSCPVSNLVYDPYNNICEYPYQFPCKILNSLCAGKADGKYLIPDVFAYLQCSSQQGGYVNCPDNQIFDPKYSDCKDAKDYNLNNFCTNKPDGQYRNPWNCHTFISCSNGISHNMSCATPVLVYDPYDNLCEYPSLFPCRTVNMKTNIDVKIGDICTTLSDGNYATRNVFQILKCKNHKSSMVDCPTGEIYIPGDESCSKNVNLDNFCKTRAEGNWQNPWDCHTFLTCHGQQTTVRNCSAPSVVLNYDPVTDVCEYPYQVDCVQIKTRPYEEVFVENVVV
nr:uncharacterized protein LOC100197130 isoform X2 [Hydra vulgaris]